MAGLKVLLGLFPNTTNYEEKKIELEKEFNSLNEFASSNELKQFKQLEGLVTSEKFKIRKNEILREKYKDSEPFNKEQEFLSLKNSKDIKQYLKTNLSEEILLYNKVKASGVITKLQELETFVKSEQFLKVQEHYKLPAKTRFELSDLGHTLKQYENQSNSEEISGYFEFISDKLYTGFEKMKDTKELNRYLELNSIIESHEFKSKKKSLSKEDFANSKEGKLFDEFTNLSKISEIEDYLKLESSHNKKYYDALHGSDQLLAYEELDKFIHSHDFENQKQSIMETDFHDTQEYKKKRELDQMMEDPNIKIYFKLDGSEELSNFNKLNDSDKIHRYHELESYIESKEFKDQKAYLSLNPKTRWMESEENKQLEEYKRLKKSEKIKRFFSKFNHKKYNWHREWNLTFIDEFNSGQLDTQKWLTRYYYGEEMLQKSYSLTNELHYISDGDNLDLSANHLKIVTRKEKAEGIKWNPELGFFPTEFDYTSGLINSGKSFRQKFGVFEAKIKFSSSSKLLNAFWMVGNQQTPHIDVAKANGVYSVGINSENNKFIKTLNRAKFSGKYFIYTMEWTPNKITWKINGLEIASTTSNIPQEEMYIALSSGIYSESEGESLPAMEVDWVRCYQKASKKK